MNPDPRVERLADVLAGRSPRRIRRTARHREAAVALVVRPEDDLEILLVQRTLREADPWSGHTALPGGRRHPGDPDLVATALRETEEEVGVPIAAVGRALGFLDDVEPATPRLPPVVIAPMVAAVPAGTEASPDGREVESAFWASLSSLRDPASRARHRVDQAGHPRVFPAIRHGEHVVWGLTHRILSGFLEVAERAGL